jgi:hypothetical protein
MARPSLSEYRGLCGDPEEREGWELGPRPLQGERAVHSLRKCKDSSAPKNGGSVESHVIPAKAGIQFVRVTWTPAYAGVTP